MHDILLFLIRYYYCYYYCVIQWCRRVVRAWCQSARSRSSSAARRPAAAAALSRSSWRRGPATAAAALRHILGVSRLPSDNASTSVFSTSATLHTHHVTAVTSPLVASNMATCWTSRTRRTCRCVRVAERSCGKAPSISPTRTVYRLYSARKLTRQEVFSSKCKVTSSA